MKKLRLRKLECTPLSPIKSAAVFGGLALALGLTGCAGATPVAASQAETCPNELAGSASTVVIAATATSAEPAPTLPSAVRSQLRATADKGIPTCVDLVTPQGHLLALDVTPRRPNGQVENGPGRSRKVEKNLDLVAARLGELAADQAGLDPVRAISLATRLHVTPGRLIVVTSGVSTQEPVDLRSIGWDPDIAGLTSKIVRSQQVPMFTGWKIQFVGIGDVAAGGRQPALGIALHTRLQQWWTAVCRAAGGQCSVDPELLTSGPSLSTNRVPVVPLPAATVTSHRVELPNALLFAKDSAVLQAGVDPLLQAIVNRARMSGESVGPVGYTDASTGSPGYNKRLSQRRADAVAARLLQLGLPERQLGTTKGVGQAGASVAAEKADPAQVSRDRKVVVFFGTAASHETGAL